MLQAKANSPLGGVAREVLRMHRDPSPINRKGRVIQRSVSPSRQGVAQTKRDVSPNGMRKGKAPVCVSFLLSLYADLQSYQLDILCIGRQGQCTQRRKVLWQGLRSLPVDVVGTPLA